MKTFNLSALLLVSALATSAASAQDNPAVAPAATPPAVAPVKIEGFVYVEKLPTPTQLMADAEAEHLTITRMDQTAGRIVVVYRYPDGHARTFAFTTVEPTGPAPGPVAMSQATYQVVSAPPAQNTVIYTEPAPVYYYGSPDYYGRHYDPAWDFWAPLSIGVGIGWGFGGHEEHEWHGGFEGHEGHHEHGGRHR